jgi:hypothetical protein
MVVRTKICLHATHSKALRDHLEARVPNLLSLNAQTKLGDLNPQCASQFDLKLTKTKSKCQIMEPASCCQIVLGYMTQDSS